MRAFQPLTGWRDEEVLPLSPSRDAFTLVDL
jgi:hypothetical protein